MRKHGLLAEVKAEHFVLFFFKKVIVRPPGVEPGTHGLKVRCSTS